jgi:hypothetical protein
MAVATVTRPLVTMSAGYDVLYAARAYINALNQASYGRPSAFGSNRRNEPLRLRQGQREQEIDEMSY